MIDVFYTEVKEEKTFTVEPGGTAMLFHPEDAILVEMVLKNAVIPYAPSDYQPVLRQILQRVRVSHAPKELQ